MLVPKILKFLQEKRQLGRDLELDIQSIQYELGMIAASIEDHDRRSWSSGTSDTERIWIQGVRDLAYSIEDSMDRFLHRVSLDLGASSLRQKGHRLMTMSIRNKFAAEIRDLKKKSEDVSRQREKYTHGGQSTTSGLGASDTHATTADLVGMDTHRDELLELIREDKDHPESEQLKVISIVGFGGLGKTVLARQVFDLQASETNTNHESGFLRRRRVRWMSSSTYSSMFQLLWKQMTAFTSNTNKGTAYVRHRRYSSKLRSSVKASRP